MLILGSALAAGTLLLAALLFRRPDPPRWSKPDLAAHAGSALRLGTPASLPEQPAEPAHLHAA